ncbi:MbtH family protein [Streptomyces sp. NPDC093085]|uniref:MbtH family protein n=1 Tax=Streptomyces sp. NPDC093085 TaxID=3155068 RepID=UPI003432AA81
MFDDEDREFRVVVNHEEQHSIWPADRELPAGWRAEGFDGDRAACLAHIDRVWTDLRPLSLRTTARAERPDADVAAGE